MSVSTIEPAAADFSPRSVAPATREGLRVEVGQSFAAIKPVWDSLNLNGVATPYQQFGWVESYFRTIEAPAGAEPVLVLLRDGAGDPVLLLPFSVSASRLGRVARFIGGKHANFHMPLIGRGAALLGAAELRAALKEAGRQAGIDLFILTNQPLEWEGVANPMALLGGQASPSAGFKTALEADGEAMLQRRLSKDRRRKMRQKDVKLAALGTVSYRKAATNPEARTILDRFFEQKSERFSAQGIDDPFATPQVRAFLEEVATQRDAAGKPILDLYALMLNDRPVAIFGGVDDGKRFSGVVTAFDADEEIARTTPGESLLMLMVKDCCARGVKTFDLGVGEARYKMAICDQSEALIDTFVPVSLRGRMGAAAAAGALAAKRLVKQSAPGRWLIARVRKARAQNAA